MPRTPQPTKTSGGFSFVEVFLILVVLLVLGLVGYFIFRSPGSSPTTPHSADAATSTAPATSQSASPYAVLSPATVPSKTAECSQQLTYAGTGNPEPVTCANGGLNVNEWQALAALEPKVMTLGYDATLSQVQSALCTDATDSNSDANTDYSNIIEETTYQIAALYYGWDFSSNPSVVLTNGSC
jgi:hypothetical protein